METRIRSLGHFLQDEIEVLVPKNAVGDERKLFWKGVPETHYELALGELASKVKYLRKMDGTVIKDEENGILNLDPDVLQPSLLGGIGAIGAIQPGATATASSSTGPTGGIGDSSPGRSRFDAPYGGPHGGPHGRNPNASHNVQEPVLNRDQQATQLSNQQSADFQEERPYTGEIFFDPATNKEFPHLFAEISQVERKQRRIKKELEVSVDKIGLLIGRGGSKVRDIQDQSGAEVVIEPTNFNVSPPQTKVKVTGDPERVEAALKILNEILEWAAAHPREEAGTEFK